MSSTTGPDAGAPLPPESWPGAGGRRSQAPPVAAWPGQSSPRSATPGESWPGATPGGADPTPATARSATARDLDDDALRDLRLRRPGERVSPKAKNVWRLVALAVWIWPIVGVVTWIVVDDEHGSWQLGALAAAVLLLLLFVTVVPALRYSVHRWEVSDEAVYTQTGWLSRHRRIAPISRIQTVDSEYGPIERLFGLGTLTVTTASAAGPLRVSGLERNTVEGLVADLTRITAAERDDAT